MDELYVMESIYDSQQLHSIQVDVMIIAASCDDRAYEGLSRILKENVKVNRLFVLKYRSQAIAPNDSLFEAYSKYTTFNIPITEFEIDDDIIIFNPEDFANKNILLDITGFSIPNLFRILYVLCEVLLVSSLHTIYTEPAHYIFNKDTFGSYTYFIGEREYRAVDEFYVSGSDGRELLTIFLGFDRITSTIVKEAVDPTETILVNGFPAMTPKLKDVSLLNNHELIAILGRPHYSVKATNPFATYNVLSQIQRKYTDMLLNVCILGTKPMALGAGLYALRNKNVKLSYAHTTSHAAETTKGSSMTWYYSIQL